MAIEPYRPLGTPRSIPSSVLPVRQTKPPTVTAKSYPQVVHLSAEARENITNPGSKLTQRLFGDTQIPKSLALSRCAQQMSVKTYQFLNSLYPELDAEQALMRGMRELCPSSQEHCQRVGELAAKLARELDLTEEEYENLEDELEKCSELKEAGILALLISSMSDREMVDFLDAAESAGEFHDIGKLALPADIINKPGPLSEEEYEIVKLHPLIGETMLTPLGLRDTILQAVRGHHEQWNGDGYPDGLAGSEIPVVARILSIVDSFDAMTAGRPYRNRLTVEDALKEILACAGTQFDPFLAGLFADLMHR